MTADAGALCRTLVDEWVRAGVRHAFVAPGSRSTPLALALADRAQVHTEVALDERTASFMALGAGLARGMPAVVLTTSGTATTHLHAAVVEASLSHVPLLVCTADRPPELHGIGAPQTIEQRGLFGAVVRAELELGVPDAANHSAWRSFGARAVAECLGVAPGPVHVNLPFREPLVGPAVELPPGRPHGAPWHVRLAASGAGLSDVVAGFAVEWPGRRGVIVAGGGTAGGAGVAMVERAAAAAEVLALGRVLGWPVLADPRSGCRFDDDVSVAHADALLRDAEWSAAQRPEVIVSFGQPPASKVLAAWLSATAAADRSVPWVQVDATGSWWDPGRSATHVIAAAPARFAAALRAAVERAHDGAAAQAVGAGATWAQGWRRADDVAAAVLADELRPGGGDRPSEPAVARAVAEAAAHHQVAAVVVSSSMPVRDLEWYSPRAPRAATPLVLANRGANGIDGVVATALGVACVTEPGPVWLHIGDLALLHDANALLNAAARPGRLRIVVVDNGGGGIFSFLPQAAAVEPSRFEQLFGTAQDVDLVALLRLHHVRVEAVDHAAELPAALDRLAGGDDAVAAVVVHVIDRDANTLVHDHLHQRITAARRALDAGGDAAGAPAAAGRSVRR